MSLIRIDGGTLLANDQPLNSLEFMDKFQLPDGARLAPWWTQLKDVAPSNYDRLIVVDGEVRIEDPFSRSDNMNDFAPLDDWRHYFDYPGKIVGGVAGAFREFGPGWEQVRVKVRWLGNNHPHEEAETAHHVEATPLIHVNPESELMGMGVWPSNIGVPLLLVGYVGNPPEAFTITHVGTFSHVDGTERDVEIRSTGTHITFWLDGVQQPMETFPEGVSIGLAPIPIDPELQGSTKHGFAIDAHIVKPVVDMPLWGSIRKIQVAKSPA